MLSICSSEDETKIIRNAIISGKGKDGNTAFHAAIPSDKKSSFKEIDSLNDYIHTWKCLIKVLEEENDFTALLVKNSQV